MQTSGGTEYYNRLYLYYSFVILLRVAIKPKCVFEFKRRNLESEVCWCCVEDMLDEHQPGVLPSCGLNL